MRYIDLRSDTVTKPTREMREAFLNAEVGDDVYDDDPTIKKLEEMSAAIMDKEAALFTPSGTMANQLAIMAHTNRGDEIILGKNCHIVEHEVGAAAILSNVSYRVIQNDDDHVYPGDIHAAFRDDDIHYPCTGLVCLENALSNGKVVSLQNMREVQEAAREYNLPIHLDGARVFTAALYLNVDVSELVKTVDSLMFCLSKGLCAPVGSMLCGDESLIMKAKKYRKLLGGGMRQAGILAAAGIIGLEKMTKRLHEDHENAKYLAKKLAEIPFVSVDPESVHINIVFFKITDEDIDTVKLDEHLLKNGIKANPAYDGIYRFVTHNDVTREDLDYVIGAIKNLQYQKYPLNHRTVSRYRRRSNCSIK